MLLSTEEHDEVVNFVHRNFSSMLVGGSIEIPLTSNPARRLKFTRLADGSVQVDEVVTPPQKEIDYAAITASVSAP